MNIKKKRIDNGWVMILLMFSGLLLHSQKVTHVYKIDQLLKRIEGEKQTCVINFWATWCKPCVAELPSFDSLQTEEKNIKVLLVSLDFSEDIAAKVDPFLKKHNIKAECVLLDEVNGNDFINKISTEWSGAIPATLFKKGKIKRFHQRKFHLSQLKKELEALK